MNPDDQRQALANALQGPTAMDPNMMPHARGLFDLAMQSTSANQHPSPWAAPHQVMDSPFMKQVEKLAGIFPKGQHGSGPEMTASDVLQAGFPHWSQGAFDHVATGKVPDPTDPAGAAPKPDTSFRDELLQRVPILTPDFVDQRLGLTKAGPTATPPPPPRPIPTTPAGPGFTAPPPRR